MTKTESHHRVVDILLGPLERPALQWLAAHMPGWVNPDILTGIGILGAVIVFSGYILTNLDKNFLWLVDLGFVINWFGDSLDGTLARYRKIERPKYGFFVDHTVDAFSQLLIVGGIGLSPYVTFAVASLALIGYLLMSILVYVRTFVTGVFEISFGKIGPTEMRLIVILANTIIYFVGNPSIDLTFVSVTVYDAFVFTVGVIMIISFVVITLRQASQLSKLGE